LSAASSIDLSLLLLNDRDVEGDSFSIVELFDADNGSVIMDGGTAQFTPRTGYFGDAGFHYRVTDARGATSIGYVNLGVLPQFALPIAVSDGGFEMLEDGILDIDPAVLLGNDFIPEGTTPIFLGLTSDDATVTLLDSGLYRVAPHANLFGQLVLTYAITNESGYAIPTTVTINVLPVADAPIAQDDVLSLTEDTPLTLFASALLANDSDPDRQALRLDAIVDSSGVAVALDALGRLTVTPDANVFGEAWFDYRVIDSAGQSAVARVTVDIAPVNDAPAIAALPLLTGAEDSVFRYAFSPDLFSDVDGDALAISVRGVGGAPLPAWLNFDPTSFVLSGTPPLDFYGQLAIELVVSDGRAETVRAAVIQITPVNDAPVRIATLADRSLAEDTALDFIIDPASFIDVDGDTLAYRATLASGDAMPAWLGFDGLRITGTPPADFAGQLDLTVTASDGLLSATANFRLTVTAVNDRPTLVRLLDDVSVSEDTLVDFLVPFDRFADVDGDALTFHARIAGGAALPGWLQFDGARLTGQPPADYNGLIDIEITATDGALTVSDIFRLSIDPANDAPVVLAPLAGLLIAEDTPVAIDIPLGTFADIDGDALTVGVTLANGDPLPGWLSYDAETRRLTGQPPADSHGRIDLAVTASDGTLSVSDALSITIAAVNDAPVLQTPLADHASLEDSPVIFTLPESSFTDVDGDALTLTARQVDGNPLPAWLHFDGQSFTGTPPANFNGMFDIEVFANDGLLAATDSFRLKITSVNDAPTVVTGIADASIRNRLVDIAVPLGNFADADGDLLTVSVLQADGSALPAWLSFANGRLTGTAPTDVPGPLVLVARASDGQSSVDDGFTLTFEAANSAPTVVTISSAAIAENAAAGTVVGRLAAIDGDAGDTHSFALAATSYRLDQALRLDPTAPVGIAYTGAPVTRPSGLLLTSMGRFAGAQGQGSFTVWRIRNSNAAAQTVRLNAASGQFDRTLTVGANSDTYVLSTDTAGSSTHRLYLGTALVDTKAASTSAFSASTPVSMVNPLFEIVGNQLRVRVGAALDFERLASTTVTVLATDAAGLSVSENLTITIGDVADYQLITGSDAANTLTGTAFADHLRGLGGNDRLTGDGGDDLIDGGAGTGDVAVFAGEQASYAIATNNGNVTIVDTVPTLDGNDGTDAIVGVETLEFKGGVRLGIASPIILDLDGNGVETLTAATSHARFDMDGDGLADDTSWFGRGEGLLFLDRDGNGTVSNAGEFSFVGDVAGARSDLEGLAAFDSNRDGRLDANDARFASFRIWRDRDGDGAADTSEIMTLGAAGVRSIALTGTAVNATTQPGEVAIVNRGSFGRTDGTVQGFIDAALTFLPSATAFPTLATQFQQMARKADRYVIRFADGAMTLALRDSNDRTDPRAGALSASSALTFRKGARYGLLSPIILDLDGDGVELRGMRKSKAAFDMNADGIADDTGWAGRDDGFLVIDRNLDGLITHASELSLAVENSAARSDLDGLAVLDSNEDGVVDARDSRFGELKIWVDANGNGTTDAGELGTLADHGITSLSLSARHIDGSARLGQNILISTATFTRSNGSTGTLGNVALAYRPGSDSPVAAPPLARRLQPMLFPEDGEVDAGTDGQDDGLLPDTLQSAFGAGSGSGLAQWLMGDAFERIDALGSAGQPGGAVPTSGPASPATPPALVSAPENLLMEPRSIINASKTGAGRLGSILPLDKQVALMVQDMAAFDGPTRSAADKLRRWGDVRPYADIHC
jgi:Bacterial Ig domain/Cadherin-like domain/Putative Ig domain